MQDRAYDERLRSIVNGTGDVLWDIDLKTSTVWWNEGMRALFGYTPQEIGSSTTWCHEHIHPEDRERVVAGMMRAVEQGDLIWEDEFRYRKADGTYLNVLDRGSIIRDQDGNALRFIGIMQDISSRRAIAERYESIAREFSHRMNNALAVVLGIFNETSRGSRDLEELAKNFNLRIQAMATANRLIAQNGASGADLFKLATTHLAPFSDRISIDGPAARVELDLVQPLSLAINELATNALKYGSLSTTNGRVSLAWQADKRTTTITWKESDGPPVKPPTKEGLGTKLLDRGIPGARVSREFEADGFKCVITLARSNV